MDFSSWVGSTGVSMLLLAFLLNLMGYIEQHSRIYLLLNVLGAALSCLAAVLIHYIPFIILEGCWCLAALVPLVKKRAVSR